MDCENIDSVAWKGGKQRSISVPENECLIPFERLQILRGFHSLRLSLCLKQICLIGQLTALLNGRELERSIEKFFRKGVGTFSSECWSNDQSVTISSVCLFPASGNHSMLDMSQMDVGLNLAGASF